MSEPASGDVGADDESAERVSEAAGAEASSEVAPVESGAFEVPASEPAASDEPAAAAFGPPAR